MTKSEEAVLFRNYGATGTTDDDSSSDGDTGKIGEPHVVIGNTNNLESGKEEEEDRDGKNVFFLLFASLCINYAACLVWVWLVGNITKKALHCIYRDVLAARHSVP